MRAQFGAVGLAFLVACGGGAATRDRTPRSGETATGSTVGPVDANATAWAERGTPERADLALRLRRARASEATDDAGAWVQVAEAHFFIGSVYAADGTARQEHADLAVAAAERAMELLSPGILEAVRAGHRPVLTPELVPAVYWRIRGRRLGATARGYAATLLIHHEDVASMIECARLIASYDEFGAFVFLGRALSRTPDLTTRDLTAAAQYFERAIGAAPQRVAYRIAYAEHYAVVAGDSALFQRELKTVQDAQEPAGDQTGETARAKARATQLLDQLNELFE